MSQRGGGLRIVPLAAVSIQRYSTNRVGCESTMPRRRTSWRDKPNGFKHLSLPTEDMMAVEWGGGKIFFRKRAGNVFGGGFSSAGRRTLRSPRRGLECNCCCSIGDYPLTRASPGFQVGAIFSKLSWASSTTRKSSAGAAGIISSVAIRLSAWPPPPLVSKPRPSRRRRL